MKAKVIHIGNSLGIRIPKVFIEECKIKDEVILEKVNEKLLITPVNQNVRKGWEEKFRKMADSDKGILIDDSIENEFDQEEWEW